MHSLVALLALADRVSTKVRVWSRPGWDALGADEQSAIEAEVVALLEPYRAGERLDIPVELNLAVAVNYRLRECWAACTFQLHLNC